MNFVGIALCGLALISWTGWLFKSRYLTSWGEGLVPMKPITAFGFLVFGLMLIVDKDLTDKASSVIGWIIACSASLLLADNLSQTGLHLEHLVAPIGAQHGLTSANIRMSTVTAVAFCCGGIATVLHATTNWRHYMPLLASSVGLIGSIILIGYIYDAETLNTLSGFETVSLPTSVGLLLLSVGLLARKGVIWPEFSLKVMLSALALGVLVPALVFMFAQTRQATAERLADIEQDGRQLADQVARTVDRLVAERVALLRGLATSTALKSKDLAAFYDQARTVITPQEGAILVSDSSKRMLLSTIVPFGSPLPQLVATATAEQARLTGRPQVSDLYQSPFTSRYVISIHVPVQDTDLVLQVALLGEWLSEQIAVSVPTGWTIAVTDRNGVLAARNRDAGQWIGQPASRSTSDKITSDSAGWISSIGLEGRPIYVAWKRLPFGWIARAGYEESQFRGEVHAKARALSFGATITIVHGLLLAALSAFAIGRPLGLLSSAADSLGTGLSVPLPRSALCVVREIASVGEAMRVAASTRRAIETDLRASENEAQRQQSLFRSVFDSSPDAMVLSDLDRNILEINPAFTEAFGFTIEKLKGASTRTLYATDAEWSAVGALLKSGQSGVHSQTVHFRRENGTQFPAFFVTGHLIDATGNERGYLGIIRDISAERQRELEFQEKKRLEALGRITGGIAHDFNNVLTIVGGNIQLSQLAKTKSIEEEHLNEAMRAIEMGARLNQRLMLFARQRQLAPIVVDLNSVVAGIIELITRSLGGSITVEARLDESRALICVDPGEMENAIINLALNARDSMPDGGRLKVQTKRIEIAEPTAEWSDAELGSYIQLSMTDSGSGMTDDVRSRAFDPFYTTKSDGKGTGLGLATVHGFIKQSGGLIEIDSAPGQGTCVRMLLPSVDGPAAAISGNDARILRRPFVGGTILLVDDNSDVRRATKALIEQLGYSVIDAGSGPAALAILENQKIDLVLSDIVMPGGMSGFDLALQLDRLKPGLPILLTSGFSDLAQRKSGTPDTIQVLQKPFNQAQLAEAIAARLSLGDREAGVVQTKS